MVFSFWNFFCPGGGIKLISELITAEMGLPVSVLMGANLANEVVENLSQQKNHSSFCDIQGGG